MGVSPTSTGRPDGGSLASRREAWREHTVHVHDECDLELGPEVGAGIASRIAFASGQGGGFAGVFLRPLTGAGPEELVVRPGTPADWSRDGRFVLFERGGNLWALPDLRSAPDPPPLQLTRTAFREAEVRFSPDGRWVAYVSDESGRNEVYIQAFGVSGSVPSLGAARVQISSAGATRPEWRGDGRELFYVSEDRQMRRPDAECRYATRPLSDARFRHMGRHARRPAISLPAARWRQCDAALPGDPELARSPSRRRTDARRAR